MESVSNQSFELLAHAYASELWVFGLPLFANRMLKLMKKKDNDDRINKRGRCCKSPSIDSAHFSDGLL